MELKDKVVFITGSTRGIGAATALAFAKQGSRLVLNGRHDLDDDMKQKLEEAGADYKFLIGDVADEESVAQLAKEAWDAYGHIDVLVNNAGITRDRLIGGMKVADFDQVIAVNLRGPFLLIKALIKKFNKQRSGAIINLASVVGLHGNAGQANYSASKAGIVGLTMRGIRCNAIAPGMIASDMTAALSERVQEGIVEQIPLKRLGTVDEVAQCAIFLAQNDYVTGQVLVVDGGMTI